MHNYQIIRGQISEEKPINLTESRKKLRQRNDIWKMQNIIYISPNNHSNHTNQKRVNLVY